MGRKPGSLIAVLVVAMVLGGSGRLEAGQRQDQPDLDTLLPAIGLTGDGTGRWLDRLAPISGVAGHGRTPLERLIAITVSGEVVATIDGVHTRVELGAALDERCLRAGAAIVLIHNHPNGTGLSAEDLGQLDKPGVAAIIALGHDGSVYAAAAGPRYPAKGISDLYAAARKDAERELRDARALLGASAAESMPHLMAVSLAKAGVIEYHGALAPARLAAFSANRAALGRVIAAAEHRAAALAGGR